MSWQQILRVINGVLNIGGARITNVTQGVSNSDAATVGQVRARTPQITPGMTAPSNPQTNDLWLITDE